LKPSNSHYKEKSIAKVLLYQQKEARLTLQQFTGSKWLTKADNFSLEVESPIPPNVKYLCYAPVMMV